MQPSRLLPVLAGVCVLGLAVTFLVALHTAQGVHDDAALYRHVSGNAALLGTMASNAFYLTMQFYYFYAFAALALATPLVFARSLERGERVRNERI